MTYTITLASGRIIKLTNSSVHELKGQLRKLRLERKEVVGLIVGGGGG